MPTELSRCHYCGASPASTRDHIVPRAFFRVHYPSGLPIPNTVKCCVRCNQLKGHYRSDCHCEVCEAAWAFMAQLSVPKNVVVMPVIALVTLIDGRDQGGAALDAVIDALREHFGRKPLTHTVGEASSA